MSRVRSGLSYANVMATLAFFLALGGGAYAAVKLPRNSVGSRQIKANAVRSSKVKNGSLLGRDFKEGELPRGATGARGPGGPKGDRGSTGPRGPGTFTLDGQFNPIPNNSRSFQIGNGLLLSVACYSGVQLKVERVDSNHGFYGWGTASAGQQDGTSPVTSAALSTPVDSVFHNESGTTANLDVVAHSTLAGEPIKYSRVDASVVHGSMCNYHAVVIPPG